MPHNQPAVRGNLFRPELGTLDESERVSICEVLDRVLNKGIVVAGEINISVADVDLLYLGVNLILTSVETARESQKGGKPDGYGQINAGRI